MIAEQITEFSNSDFKKFATSPKPTLAMRYSIEVLRRVIDPAFQSSKADKVFLNLNEIILEKSSIESWANLQEFMKQNNLMDRIKIFNVFSIDQARLKMLKHYTENREMKIAKLEIESKLSAMICKWVLAAISVAEASLSVGVEQAGIKESWTKLHQEREKLIVLQKEKEKLEKNVHALKHNVTALEGKVTKIRRAINYRQRGARIIEILSSLEPRLVVGFFVVW